MVQWETDKDVVQVSRKFLPGIAVGGCPPDLRFPCGDFRLLHRPHLPQWPNGLHAMQQKSEHQLPEAHTAADTEAGGTNATEILQLSCAPGGPVLPECAAPALKDVS